MADVVADGCSRLPDDVLAQILLLIPTRSRRQLRVVCKWWRTVIDERTPPEEKLHSKILVFINQGRSSSALVFDRGGSVERTREWTYTSSSDEGRVQMVGTCNGLLCLHDHSSYGGVSSSAVRVTNPVTGETLALPPLPERWGQLFVKLPGKYSFGFHPATRRHKVVYIPRGRRRSVDALLVFTLGDDDTAAWREVPVPTPGACYDLPCEPVSVGGSTYWLSEFSGRVMALDLGDDERVKTLDVAPAMSVDAAAARRLSLTQVHESLGVVVVSLAGVGAVWVLDGGGGEAGEKPQWSRRYTVAVGDLWSGSWVMAPQLTHGDYILSEWLGDGQYTPQWWRTRTSHLCRHRLGELTGGGGPVRPPKEAQLIMSNEERQWRFTTFAYVETLNPVPGSTK